MDAKGLKSNPTSRAQQGGHAQTPRPPPHSLAKGYLPCGSEPEGSLGSLTWYISIQLLKSLFTTNPII